MSMFSQIYTLLTLWCMPFLTPFSAYVIFEKLSSSVLPFILMYLKYIYRPTYNLFFILTTFSLQRRHTAGLLKEWKLRLKYGGIKKAVFLVVQTFWGWNFKKNWNNGSSLGYKPVQWTSSDRVFFFPPTGIHCSLLLSALRKTICLD